MGGIWKKIPLTYAMMWIGSLALAGVFPFAGFYSKDAVLEAAYASHIGFAQYGFWCGILAAFLTAFYSWRLLILTFHGAPRADQHTMDHVHESPLVMTVPLMLLAAGAVLTGFTFANQLLGDNWQAFWGASIHNGPHNHVLHDMHQVPGWVIALPAVMGISGIALAYAVYMGMPALPAQMAERFGGLYRFLLNKWYFDELYDRIIVRPTMSLARSLWQVGDATIIDGIPNGVASLTAQGAGRVVKVQTGSIAHYAFAMLIGVVVLVSIYLIIR
jgi:NADH-quinone oxidoreductase subunit L